MKLFAGEGLNPQLTIQPPRRKKLSKYCKTKLNSECSRYDLLSSSTLVLAEGMSTSDG